MDAKRWFATRQIRHEPVHAPKAKDASADLGQFAKDLKSGLVRAFSENPNVVAAYLAFPDEHRSGVAVYVRTEVGPDLRVSEAVNGMVRSLDCSRTPIHLVFVGPKDEQRILGRCKPFFGSSR